MNTNYSNKDKKYKVSIVVPVYNVEKYIDRCINSLVNQSLKDIEIILVDDESKDKSGLKCDKYAVDYNDIKVIHKRNGGLGLARNSGIEAASGEYVAFVDSDDFIDPEMMKVLYEECISNNLDVVYSEFNVDHYPGYKVHQRKEKVYYKKEIEQLRLDLIGPEPTFPGSVKFEASACKGLYSLPLIKANDIKFRSEREFISEDVLFNLDFLKYSTKVKTVPFQYYHYCKNEASLTHSYRPDRWKKLIVMLNEFSNMENSFFDSHDLHLRISRTFIAYLRMTLGIEVRRRDIGTIEKYKNIRKILSEDLIIKYLRNYPFGKLPLTWRLYGYCIIHKQVKALYIISVLKG